MHDTSKNHILFALHSSENRMKKFQPVQKLDGGASEAPPPLGSNVTILAQVAEG